ncbi:hypothetical protein OWM54_06880 [Myxococcus sp. MISCRS1]|uniref:hypothetical protein n=1 Tax=Myxococcus TaxID=32 RepID=UPI001CBBDC78|nr:MULTISPECIES: hypothetical protein [unclassified Myxococcus]MBZ4400808.1 hypothetical protein [Myxococcus sp. AS-1-15]MCY0996863.1 hypothetical protein [Myxococcus sp. MISCRS1]BDT33125.1 hypothetical protein MFMH1_27940 [Myxococcus sp. MH1]
MRTVLAQPRGRASRGLALALLFAAGGARADWKVEYNTPAPLFLDRSYIFGSPNRIRRQGDPDSPAPLLFEAQLAPNLFLPQLHTGRFRSEHGEWFLTAVLTPYIRLRMLNTDSSPVIPPSYVPKITLQVAHLRVLPGSLAEDRPMRGLALAANLTVGHYSNGQDGCFFANQEGTDPDCAPAQGELPLNELTGSFSTNFVRGELHARVAFGVDPDLDSAWLVGGGSFLELNTAIGSGGITEDQRRVYGKGNWGVSALGERIWHQHRFRLEGTVSAPFGETPHRRATVSGALAALPYWGAGFGVFTRYVYGQDSYNILFLERLSQWQFGLVFELSPGARLKAEEAPGDTGTRRPPGFR